MAKTLPNSFLPREELQPLDVMLTSASREEEGMYLWGVATLTEVSMRFDGAKLLKMPRRRSLVECTYTSRPTCRHRLPIRVLRGRYMSFHHGHPKVPICASGLDCCAAGFCQASCLSIL